MSDVPTPEINPVSPDVPAAPIPEPQGPDISPASTPEEAPSPAPNPDDGRAYD